MNRRRGHEERYADLKESRVRKRRRFTKDSQPPQSRSSATLSREQRVRMLVHNAQRLHCTTQFIIQEYLNLVDWKGLELLYKERRCKASVKKFECFPTCWAGCGQSGLSWKKLSQISKLGAARRCQTTRGPMISVAQ